MTPELIIFDCDGVLIDSEIIACRVDAEALTALGIPTTTEEMIRRFLGVSQKDQRSAIEQDIGRRLPDSYEARVDALIETAMTEELKAVSGVHEVVAQLPVPFCIASSSTQQKLKHTLALTRLYDLFAPNVFSTTEVANGKPAPDLFLHSACNMGAEPSRCLVVEDSTAGIRAAKAAGMHAVGFVGGSHCGPDHADRLREVGADLVIDRMEDLGALLAV